MEIKDRQGNIILSDKGQDNMLERLYRTVGGSIALKGLTAPLVSKAAGRFCDSILSAKLIPSFIEKAGDFTDDVGNLQPKNRISCKTGGFLSNQ